MSTPTQDTLQSPIPYASVEACADAAIAHVGKRIVLAIPLGIGKPNQLVNAFFRRAQQDSTLSLKIITALTLEKPHGSSELERRFLEPFVARVFGNYPELDYATAIRNGTLPANVEVAEFFFKPGGYLHAAGPQQHYISSNYTHVARDLGDHGVNVMAQLVAKKTLDGTLYYSLGSNPDVTLDLLALLRHQQRPDNPVAVLAQVNAHMPFMYHDAMVEAACFDAVVDAPGYDFTLFGPPTMPVGISDYALGLNASALIKDGGTLQIGIGALGDALAYALHMRHCHNQHYNELLGRLQVSAQHGDLIHKIGGSEPFTTGLYGATEMFVDGFWQLYRSGILKRRVYDSVALQRLLNQGLMDETITPETLTTLLAHAVIQPQLTPQDFALLQRFGIFKPELRYQRGYIHVTENFCIAADLSVRANRAAIVAHCLGTRLQGGVVLHAGFFLGPQRFYQALNGLDAATCKDFYMTSVAKVNQLYGGEELRGLQRRQARFCNTTLMVTLTGAAVSDGLEDGQVISGVGGQYNFVAMAHALPQGRSILLLRSTRAKGGELASNILWNYGHVTIPRHLRDIVVSEYGIADLRGKSDADVIIALLNISDSRFQPELLAKAKAAGKLAQDYEIPAPYRNNTGARLEAALAPYRVQGILPDFPFGSDFTPEEIVLGKVLKNLRGRLGSIGGLMKSALRAIEVGRVPEQAKPYLARLDLENPSSWKDEVIQRLLVAELIAGNYIDAGGDEAGDAE